MFKLKEAITVYNDTSKTQVLFTIKANRWLDWSAAYSMLDADGIEIGKIARKGWQSMWKAEYDIIDQHEKLQYKVQEASIWTRIGDSLMGDIPIVGFFTGYMFHPTYNVSDINGDIVVRLKKKPSFFGKEFEVEKVSDIYKDDKVTPMPVQLGQRMRGSVVISGINVGDVVITAGQLKLQPGSPITPIFVDGSAPAPDSGKKQPAGQE